MKVYINYAIIFSSSIEGGKIVQIICNHDTIMKKNVFGKVPDQKKLLYDGKPNLEEDLYLFHVAPIPTVCHAKVLDCENFCRVRFTLLAHNRYLTLEELCSAKDHMFEEDEALVYLFSDNVPGIGRIPDNCYIPFIEGTTRPEVTAYAIPINLVPDMENILKRFEFTSNSLQHKQRVIGGKHAVVIHSEKSLTIDELDRISDMYFDEAIMFHTSTDILLNSKGIYIVWNKEDFPELGDYLE